MGFGDALMETIKWFLAMVLAVGGFAALYATNQYGMRPIILAVFSFGGCYLLSGSWRDLSEKILVMGGALMAGTAILAYYLPDLMLTHFDVRYYYNYFLRWAFLNLVIAVPIMFAMFVRHK